MSQPNETGAVELNSADSIAQEILNREEAAADLDDQEELQDELQDEDIDTDADDEVPADEDADDSDEEEADKDADEDEEADEEPDEDSDEAQFESLDDFAEALDMDSAEFMDSIKTKVKVNGEEFEVSLSDLRNGYQMEADYRKKTADLADHRKEFVNEVEAAKSEISQRIQLADQLVGNVEQMFMREFEGINWDGLEASDREEWLVQRQKFAERYQQVQALKAQVNDEAGRISSEAANKSKEEQQAIAAQETQLLLDKIPEWKDPEVRKGDLGVLVDTAKQYGFTEGEIDQAVDHRIFMMMNDIAKLKSQQTKQVEKTDIAKKKVKKLPKLLKPGQKRTTQQRKATRKNEATQKFMKSGSRDDLVEALMARSS